MNCFQYLIMYVCCIPWHEINHDRDIDEEYSDWLREKEKNEGFSHYTHVPSIRRN